MTIYLDWVLYEFSFNTVDVLIVGKDEFNYHLFTYKHDDEFVTIWYEEKDIEGVISDIKEPENSSEFYRATIENILKGNVM
jgi:hypothetical protein